MSDLYKTLFLTCQTPFPPVGGAALRNWQNINILKSLGELYIFSIPLPFNKIENCTNHVPNITHWEEHVVTDQIKYSRIKSWLSLIFPQLNFEDRYFRKAIANRLMFAMETFRPNLVVVSELGVSSYLDIIADYSCEIIFDNHNVESQLYQENHSTSVRLRDKIRHYLTYLRIKKMEEKSIGVAKQVWLCSESDRKLTAQVYGHFQHTRVVPNGINIQYYADLKANVHALPKQLHHQHTVIFIGSFGYYPNKMAAKWLLDEIFPAIQKRYPESRLILAGSSPTSEMQSKMKANSKVTITGRVEDLRPYLSSASVVLIPLKHGGGTRLKILEAFAAGRAVVSTSKGAEGLSVVDGQHLLIRNTTDDLVNGVCDLWESEVLRLSLIQKAYELVKSTYSWEAIATHIQSNLQELS